jgi:hypothetical protein
MTPDDIIRDVFKHEQQDYEGRFLRNKKMEAVQARQRAMYLIKHFFPKTSYSQLGRYFGKDHATAMHSCRLVTNFIATEKGYEKEMAVYIHRIRRAMGLPIQQKPKSAVYKMHNRRAILHRTDRGYVITLKRLNDRRVESQHMSLSVEAMGGIVELYNKLTS